ncbi:hypothetical protein [Parafrankia sp. FMc2]
MRELVERGESERALTRNPAAGMFSPRFK